MRRTTIRTPDADDRASGRAARPGGLVGAAWWRGLVGWWPVGPNISARWRRVARGQAACGRRCEVGLLCVVWGRVHAAYMWGESGGVGALSKHTLQVPRGHSVADVERCQSGGTSVRRTGW